MVKLVLNNGHKFGKLTYIKDACKKELPSGQKIRVALVKCECGEVKEVLVLHLVRGRIKSCGKCKDYPKTNEVGNKYNALTILRDLPNKTRKNGSSYRMVEVMCECGKIKPLSLQKAKRDKSCGCMSIKLTATAHTTHGQSSTRLYNIWLAMRDRCYKDNIPNFKNYGGKGVVVCEEWNNSFELFYNWSINNGYSDKLTLDRHPNKKGNYEPENCRWATQKQQQNNRNNNVLYTYLGDTMTLAELCDKYNKNYSMVHQRINNFGYSVADAIEKPKQCNRL